MRVLLGGEQAQSSTNTGTLRLLYHLSLYLTRALEQKGQTSARAPTKKRTGLEVVDGPHILLEVPSEPHQHRGSVLTETLILARAQQENGQEPARGLTQKWQGLKGVAGSHLPLSAPT